MLNRIIKLSLNSRVAVLLLSVAILIAGMIVLTRMEVDIFPDLNAPTVVVMTEAPGLAPEEVEKLVTFPIETAVNGATGVRRVRSSSSTGFSVVWVEFDWDTDVYLARQIVNEKLSVIAESLPPGVKAPTLGPQSSILGEMLIIGLQSDTTSLQDLRSLADRVIAPRLLSIGGVSSVSVIGGDVKEYQIQLSPEKMRFHNVTLNEVLDATEGMNANTSGGVIYDYGNEYLIKGDITTTSVDELAKGVIRSDENGIVTIGDIADVTIGSQSPRLGVASVKAKPAVLITVTKQPSVGTIALTDKIEMQLQELSKNLPHDIHISTDIFKQADFIDNSISNLQETLFEGALMVIVVLFFFLMNLRTTLISLVALPLSIIITILTLHLMGMSINTMSLGGIAIAIGSLVDDAIVDVENVYKRLKRNRALPASERRPTIEIVYDASKEVRMPIFNSSLIIIASFLPLFFLSGFEGRMLIPLGISFIVALIASTIVALTVTPVLCSYLLGGSGKEQRKESREPWVSRVLGRAYASALNWALRHKTVMLTTVGVLFAGAIATFFALGRSFLPSFNEGSLTINVSTLPGISLDESDKIGRYAEEIIMSIPEVKTVARKTGRAELDEHSLGVNVSEIEAPYKLNGRSRGEMVRELREKLSQIPGTNIEIGQPISHRIDAMLSGTEAQIAIKLFGDDLDKMYDIGKRIKKIISNIDGVVDVNIEQQTGRPQIDIRPSRELLSQYGITLNDFTKFINVTLGGTSVSQVYENGLPYDLVLKVSPEYNTSIDDISQLMIDSNVGKIPLGQVARVISTTGPNTINRENVSRRLVISANVDGGDLRGAVNKIRQEVDEQIQLPENYYLSYGGQFESEEQASRTLILTSIGALALIMLLLYQEFRNLGQSLIILVNMPLAMIGGVFILLFTGSELNIPAIIGFIALLGITTRNGMLLMSRYNHLKKEGYQLSERIRIGSADRLNPIIMTALTSALALIPLALRGGEPGNEIQSPLAIVILGGLISSTILNVLIVPILYSILCKKESK